MPKDSTHLLDKLLKEPAEAILRRVGLDPEDPKVVDALEEPCSFEEFNERLDALIAQRARGQTPS